MPMVTVKKKIEHFTPYIFGLILFFMQVFLKIPSRMANNVDPDQTAPSGAV